MHVVGPLTDRTFPWVDDRLITGCLSVSAIETGLRHAFIGSYLPVGCH